MFPFGYDACDSNERMQQVLQQSKMNERRTVQNIEKERHRILEDISDILLVQKIREKERKLEDLAEEFDENEIDTLEFLKQIEKEEQKQLKDEYEAIVKKQLQALQADERGKQALAAEIREIKKRQEKRAEAIRARKHALEVERERSRRIVSLPPPLPQSVKTLLKKHGNADIRTYPDLAPLVTNFNPTLPKEIKQAVNLENKENILDEKENEQKVQMQKEWNIKAKKRFNEALKRDRKKQEYDEILKQIENAEKIVRRELAKNLSKKERKLPCAFPNKLQMSEKQADMEDAVEKMYKNSNKEHAIDDTEGYEDYWEAKYKKVDSDVEAKMIDCVPSFVKNNYEYLLQDESKFECGKNFTDDDNNDEDFLNEAFIEISPQHQEETKIESEDIQMVLDQLDEMRSELKTTYEEMLKPLLEAELNAPKVQVTDKAVETDRMKFSFEDKAIETEDTAPPKAPSYIKEQRGYGSIPPYSQFGQHHVPWLDKVTPIDQAADMGLESWSSSSYYSLPSKHGVPKISKPFDVCFTDAQSFPDRNTMPLTSGEEQLSFALNEVTEKSVSSSKITSSMVKKLAEKYLGKSFNIAPKFGKEFITSDISHQQDSLKSSTQIVKKAFEKVKVDNVDMSLPKVLPNIYKRPISENYVNKNDKNSSLITADKNIYMNNEKLLIENDEVRNDFSNLSFEDLESKRLELLRQVVFENISSNNHNRAKEPIDKIEPYVDDIPLFVKTAVQNQDQNIIAGKPYVFHELSTIQEMDSALTDTTPQQSYTDQILEKSVDGNKIVNEHPESKAKSEEKVPEKSVENMHTISLLDVPQSEVSELVKGVHFVTPPIDETSQPLELCASKLEISSDLQEQTMLSSPPGTLYKGPKSITSPSSSLCSTSLQISSLSEKSHDVQYPSNNYKTSSPFIKDGGLLDQYFSDVSSIQLLRNKTKSHVSSYSSNVSSNNVLSALHHERMPISDVAYSSRLPTDFKNVEQGNILHSLHNFASYENSPDSFKPMTPHSTLPSINAIKLSRKSYMLSDSSGSFHPMTAHSTISTPKSQQIHEGMQHIPKKSDDSSAGSFQPMTTHSTLSTPDCLLFHENMQHIPKKSNDCSAGSYQPMTLHYTIRKPENLQIHDDVQHIPKRMDASSARSFKPLSTISKLSSERPSQEVENIRKLNTSETSSTGIFKPLNPDSKLSFPSDIDGQLETCFPQNSSVKNSNISSFSSGFKDLSSLKMRFDIPIPDSVESVEDDVHMSDFSQKHFSSCMPKVNCQVTLKTHSISQSPPSLKRIDKESLSFVPNNAREQGYTSEEKLYQDIPSDELQKMSIETEPRKGRLHSSSSGLFIPHLSKTGFSSSSSAGNDVLLEGSLYSVDSADKQNCESNLKSLSGSFSSVSDIEILRSEIPSAHKNHADLCLEEISLLKDYQNIEKEFLSTASQLVRKNIPEQEGIESGENTLNESIFVNLPEKQISKESQEDFTNLLKAIPSNSSDGQLSEFTQSKFAYQSSPVKSVEEIILEPGIMEEPDLTLLASGFSHLTETLEKSKKNPAINYEECTKNNTNEERGTHILPSIQIENSPTTPDGPRQFFNADTPSMISFLQHEMSCLQDNKIDLLESLKMDEKPYMPDLEQKTPTRPGQNLAPRPGQNLAPTRPGHDYKKRTKRLWNNLEEVKRKHSDAEQRKRMVLNRLKAKEFAKKLTPKRK